MTRLSLQRPRSKCERSPAVIFGARISNTMRTVSLVILGLAVVAAGGYVATRRTVALSRAPSDGDSTGLADSAQAVCGGVSGDAQSDCYDRFLLAAVRAHGVRTALGTLSVLAAHDAQLRADGHVFAHAIGIAAGRAAVDNVAGAFTSCTVIFQSGCYHGVIQAYFERVSRVDTASVNALCAAYALPGADQWLRFQCVHGMGHGLTMYYDHDLPRALTGCDLLRVEWDRESCYGGAFMENVVHATSPQHASH